MHEQSAARTRKTRLTLAVSGALLAAGALAAAPGVNAAEQQAEGPTASAEMMDSNGGTLGTVEVRQLTHGTLFVLNLEGLPPEGHGLHVHETGTCEPPDFESAGDHFQPQDTEHGFDTEEGYHAGDLPNIHASPNGAVQAEVFAPQLVLEAQEDEGEQPADDEQDQQQAQEGGESETSPAAVGPFALLDDDGAAIVIHSEPDDYQAEPPDSTGERIACGVIEANGDSGEEETDLP